jgi:hypothetical protein
MDSILAESALPLKYVAYSHCFRTEAGAAGAATRLVCSPFACGYELFCLLIFEHEDLSLYEHVYLVLFL